MTWTARDAAPPILAVDGTVRAAACRRLDVLTKPLGALGRLEPLAAQICAIQRTLRPSIARPVAVVFASDHGVAARGVSAYPSAVTTQMVQNFLRGGAAISVLARLEEMDLWVVDAGVSGDCDSHPRLIPAKVRPGTRDFVDESAMTAEECQVCVSRGAQTIEQVAAADCTIVILGEMGIGNTASSALLLHGLTGLPLHECVGRGTGLDDAGLERKRSILTSALERCAPPSDPLRLLAEFGGYEIAMLVGAILGAAARRKVILIDGFTATVAAALARRVDENVLDYCVFGHCSAELAHRAVLRDLGVEPLLDLGLRLGEGTGAVLGPR